jgi:hypothetical protein
VPEAELCRSVRRALLEEAEKRARYAPWGAFVLEVPEEVFLHRWGVRELWLWVDGQKMWCAVAGEDGVPRESFLWTVRDGVATTLVVPPGPGEALGAVLAAAPPPHPPSPLPSFDVCGCYGLRRIGTQSGVSRTRRSAEFHRSMA